MTTSSEEGSSVPTGQAGITDTIPLFFREEREREREREGITPPSSSNKKRKATFTVSGSGSDSNSGREKHSKRTRPREVVPCFGSCHNNGDRYV